MQDVALISDELLILQRTYESRIGACVGQSSIEQVGMACGVEVDVMTGDRWRCVNGAIPSSAFCLLFLFQDKASAARGYVLRSPDKLHITMCVLILNAPTQHRP